MNYSGDIPWVNGYPSPSDGGRQRLDDVDQRLGRPE